MSPRGPTPAWWAPQVLIAGLLLIAALVFALRAPEGPAPPPAVILPSAPDEPAPATEIELAVLEPSGLERLVFRTAPLPDEDAARYEAIFGALREELIETGVWPEAVPAPRAFAQRVAGRSVAVLDVAVPAGVAVDVATELRLVQSIEATAARHDVEVRYLVNGSAAETLLGHVAVASALTLD